MEVISREQARAAGEKFYFLGTPCKYGHIAKRWVSIGYCHECWVATNKRKNKRTDAEIAEQKQSNESAKLALAAGKTRYSGIACKCGSTIRHTSGRGCVECQKARQVTHAEKARASNRKSYAKNADKRIAKTIEYRKSKADWWREYNRKRRAENPWVRLKLAMSKAVRSAIRDDKAGRSWELLVGYTVRDLMNHLERQFLPGMTWENYGDWHIDHIVPAAHFAASSSEDRGFAICWSLPNLRPLWARDNMSKKDQILYLL